MTAMAGGIDKTLTGHAGGDFRQADFGEYVALLKPRVMSLVVFTALAGALAAPSGAHPMILAASIVFIALGAGASGALNMWWDADIDARMRRTQSRPVPSGAIAPESARDLGLWLGALSTLMLALAANWLAAALLAFTIFFYAVVYTMWLKRRTSQNIVIGGAAGALPPIIGWAAVTGGVSPEALLMFGIIFLWTPPHFWSLALFVKDDYGRAGVPMLTVTRGAAHARIQILAYACLLAPVSLLAAFTEIGGPVYLAAAAALGAMSLAAAGGLAWRTEERAESDGYAAEKRCFRISIWHLFGLFAAFVAEAFLKAVGMRPEGWPVWV